MSEPNRKRTAAVVGLPLVVVLGYLFQKVDKIEARERRAIERNASMAEQNKAILETVKRLERLQEAQMQWMYWRFGAPPPELRREIPTIGPLEHEGE